MTEPMTRHTSENDLMARVREGMDVYDREGHKLGSVSDVYAGDVVDTPAGVEPERGSGPMQPGTGSIIDDVARVFSDSMPEVLRNRMRHSGFIRINGGLLGRDRFAVREQVAAVDDKRVTLNVRSEELIKP